MYHARCEVVARLVVATDRHIGHLTGARMDMPDAQQRARPDQLRGHERRPLVLEERLGYFAGHQPWPQGGRESNHPASSERSALPGHPGRHAELSWRTYQPDALGLRQTRVDGIADQRMPEQADVSQCTGPVGRSIELSAVQNSP
jgi:hypothetical protein